MLDIIKPSSWVGWTAVFIVIIAAVIAGLVDGTHKMIRTLAWVIVVAVAAVSLMNSFKGK
jgi:hypothetical protein